MDVLRGSAEPILNLTGRDDGSDYLVQVRKGALRVGTVLEATMKIIHLHSDANGNSAFREIDLPLERIGVEQRRDLPRPSSMLLNETDVGHHYDWHNAPKKQWVVTLQGEIEVRLRNGAIQRFGPGSILLADDLTGTGHATSVVSSVPWRCAYIPFDGDAT